VPPVNVTVVVPVFNRWPLTAVCLAALESCDAEVVVVDNGSTDDTSKQDVAIRNDANLGFAKACNQGARAAAGDVIVFLNNDTIPQTGWLEPLVAALAKPHVAAVQPKLVYPDGNMQCAGVGVDFRKPFGSEAWNIHDDGPAGARDALTGACLAVDADAFWQAGGFDEGFRNGYEDVDLCLSLRELGHLCWYEPASTVVHLESQSDQGERFGYARTNIARLRAKWGS
jgi:GT2 family glycosyltransferase